MHKDHLLILAGKTEALTGSVKLATQIASKPATISSKSPTSPALRLTLQLQELLTASGMWADEDTAAVIGALGFKTLDEMTFTVGTAGPRVAMDLGLSFHEGDRGLFAAFMPDRPGISALTRLLPKATTGWKVGRFDCLALGKSIFAAIDAADFIDNAARKEFKREFGFDLLDDLLAHLSDDMFAMGTPLRQFDRPSETTWALAFGLRNEAKFRATMKDMLRQAKPMLNPAETIEIEGAELRRYGNLLGYDVWIGIGHGLMVMTGGRDGEQEATALLQRAQRPQPAKLTTFEDLTRHYPPGVQGVAYLDAESIVGLPSEWWMELIDELMPFFGGPVLDDPEAYEEDQERVRALLKKNNLHTTRSATGFANRRWSWRVYW